MRKLIFILTLIVVATMVKGQTATFTMPKGETYLEKTTDFSLTNTTAKWFQWNAYQDYLNTQDFQCVLRTTTAGLTRVDITLYGRKFSSDSWTQIGSAGNWQPGVNDSTVTITGTPQSGYRQFKVNYQGTGTGVVKIDKQTLKLWFF